MTDFSTYVQNNPPPATSAASGGFWSGIGDTISNAFAGGVNQVQKYMGIIIIILLATIAYYLYRICWQNRVQISRRNLDEAKVRAEEAVKHASNTLTEAREKVEKQFANAAAKLTKENPDLKVTLTKEMVQKLLELEKTTDFKLPESIAQMIKGDNLNK
jgi:phage-related protein